ncbi:hypothetical protein [Heyndrickxia oleronia]|uniref:hypothetical protein n=1 Tax=Heyndrickxia oleronia TaxID=38875 RepID=UPI003F85533A
MATYRWNKYVLNKNYDANFEPAENSGMGFDLREGYRSFTPGDWYFIVSDPFPINELTPIGTVFYFKQNSENALYKAKILRFDNYNNVVILELQRWIIGKLSEAKVSISQGSYLGEVTSTNRNAYPDNSYTSDAWYVYAGVVNTAPTTPGAFTQPTGELEIGDSKVFSVGSSSDAENNLSKYVWEASINGGSFTKIGETTTNNITYTIPSAKTLKLRVKAVDSAGLESGWRESAVFTVTKPKYYWSKYNVSPIYGIKENFIDYSGGKSKSATIENCILSVGGYVSSNAALFKGCKVDSTGAFVGENNSGQVGFYVLDTVYNIFGTLPIYVMGTSGTAYKVLLSVQDEYYYYVTIYELIPEVKGYTKTTLIQSGIIAEEGTYPTDGQQSGYWWVRGSRVNQSIAPPGPITTTKQGTILKPDELVTFTFNPSTSPNIKRYDWEMQYNENGFSVQTNDTSTTRHYRTTNNKSYTKVQFRVRAQDTNNVYSDYIYSEVYTIQHNVIPTILLNTANNFIMSETEGQNEVLVDGSARDTDANDNIIIKMQINDGTIRNIQSALSDGSTPVEFSKKITYSNKRVYDGATPISNDLSENVDHKLKVWADDGQGGISTVEERTFRVIHNRPPVISGTDEDLGELLERPSITYQVDDPEKQTATITERINGQIIRTFDAELGTEYKIEIPIEMWIPLQLEQEHKLTIEAKDTFGAKSTRTYTFTRTEDTIQVELKNPFVTDIAATRILVTPDVYLPIGSTILIEACNNAFDEVPAWEDITGMAMNKRGFNFANTEKTAEQWGINIRFTINKGTAHDQVRFNGFGGAFD